MSLDNFGYVNANIVRSAQPVGKFAFRTLNWLGIRNIVKLNEDSPNSEESVICKQQNIDLIERPIPTFINSVDSIMELASLLSGLATYKTLIHCEHGRDRTGLVVAAYRIIYDNWSVIDANEERQAYGVDGIIKIADFDMELILTEIYRRHTNVA